VFTIEGLFDLKLNR